jgi:hypothetical protein
VAARWWAAGWFAVLTAVGAGLVGAALGLAFVSLTTAGSRGLAGWLIFATAAGTLATGGTIRMRESRDEIVAGFVVYGGWVAGTAVWALAALRHVRADLGPAAAVAVVAAAAGLAAGAVAGARRPTRRELARVAPYRPGPQPGPAGGERAWQRDRARPGPDAGPAVLACDCWDWLPCPGVVLLCASPLEFAVEAAGGRLRLHRADGPAVRWPDGSVEHWWHGTEVPADAFHGRMSADRIGGIRDTEVRRAAIEIIGWPEFIRRARLRLVATAPDPGNPGRDLCLYDLPAGFTQGRTRLLVMTNGSPDRDGHDRVYAETVPAELADPVAAAAWQYGVPPDVYRELQRRT